MKPGRERSADSKLGWVSHYQRMKRWEDRAQAVAVCSFATQTPDTLDFALAYFIWAHSFRDWLVETNAVPAKEIDAYLRDNQHWQLCRDVANRCRHYNLTRSPTDNDFVILFRLDVNAALAGNSEQVFGGTSHNGKRIEFRESVNQISRMWETAIDHFSLRTAIK